MMKEKVNPVVINDVGKIMQGRTRKKITSFINNENVTIAKEDFENEVKIGQIKIILSALALQNKGVREVNLDSECITGIKEAKNLLQIAANSHM